MASKIFVSYNFDDREITHTVKSMMQVNSGKIHGKVVFVENDVSSQGREAIDREIRGIMSSCDVALFVIGNNNHNSPWIDREAELAISKGINIVVTNLPNSTSAIPRPLRNQGFYQADWSSTDLSYRLNRL